MYITRKNAAVKFVCPSPHLGCGIIHRRGLHLDRIVPKAELGQPEAPLGKWLDWLRMIACFDSAMKGDQID
jgi:hypothetical protein